MNERIYMWQDIDDERPRIDGEAVFIGVNNQGYAGCFNHLRGLKCPNSGIVTWQADYLTAEEDVQILSGLKFWMPLPPPNGQGKRPAECGSA